MSQSLFVKFIMVAIIFLWPLNAMSDEIRIPVPDTVTVVDLGSKSCIPCKMMEPVLENLKKFYADKAAIIFIDVREDPAQGAKYGIRTIPTQIFYNKEGKEVGRHEGYMEEKAMKEKIDDLL